MVEILGEASEALALTLSFLRSPLYGVTNCHKTLLGFGKEYIVTF